MPTHPKSLLTPEQYLEIERKAEYKSEYLAGEMFAMSGASRAHNYLTLDLAVISHRRGPDTTWSLLSSDSAQDTLELQSIRCRVPMAELYRQVDVPPGV